MAGAGTDQLVTSEVHDAVAVVTLDDGRANALGPPMVAAINAAIDDAEADSEVRALLLVGRDGRFSGGFDLSVIQGGNTDEIKAMAAGGGRLIRRLYGSSLPVVAACTGHAVAAGALLLLGCDTRIGPDADVKIGLNEVAIGLTLPPWALVIARERLSVRHRQRAVVNARLYDGRGAVDAGFLDRAVDPGKVVDEALAEAVALTALDPDAYAATVQHFRGPILADMNLH